MVDRTIRAFWGMCAIIWLSAGIIAAPPLTITRSGYWLTVVDAAGVPRLERIANVTDLTLEDAPAPEPIPPTPTPEDPQPPDQDFDLDIVRAAKTAAEAIGDPNGAQAIKAVYDHVASALADGLLTTDSVWPAIKTATDDALTITSSSINWSSFRSAISAIVTGSKQRGNLSTKEAIGKMLLSVAQGASMAADGKTALSDAQLVKIAIKTNEAIDGQ